MENEKKEELIRDMLRYIDPSQLTYHEWIDVGMAIKAEGLPLEVWDDWSKSDPRYKPDGYQSCPDKWVTFSGSGTTGATITHLAKMGGWQPKQKSYRGDDDWSPLTLDDEVAPAEWTPRTDPLAPLVADPVSQMVRFLQEAFEPGDMVNIVTRATWNEKHEKWVPSSVGFTYDRDYIIKTLQTGGIDALIGDRSREAGVWVRANPMDGQGVKNANVTSFRHVLVESDSMSLEKQIDTFKLLELPISTMVTSGGKSVHALVKVDAETPEEYSQRVKQIFKLCRDSGLDIDEQNKNPARLCRLPGVERGDKRQELIGTGIGRISYEDWAENAQVDDLPDFEPLSEFFDSPPELPPETIRGVLRRGEKLVLTGPSKAGKSYALIQLATCMATGGWWMGRFKCQAQRVCYINFELTKANAAQRMIDVWKALNHSKKDGMANLSILNLRGQVVTAKALVDTLIRRHKAMSNPYDMYIFDPIYKINAGDENSAKDMNELLREFDRLCSETQANMAYAHHHAKGSQFGKRALDRGSGSGVIGRDADAAIDLDTIFIPEKIREKKARETDDRDWLKASGLHVEMTLRNFENKPGFNVWWKYPVHVFDSSKEFQTLKSEGEKAPLDKAEDGKAAKKTETDEQIRTAIETLLSEDKEASFKDLEEETGLSRKRLRQYIDSSDVYVRNKKGNILRAADEVGLTEKSENPTCDK